MEFVDVEVLGRTVTLKNLERRATFVSRDDVLEALEFYLELKKIESLTKGKSTREWQVTFQEDEDAAERSNGEKLPIRCV